MINENRNMNIPTVSVTDTVNMLSALYENAIEKGIAFRELVTPFLWGPAGVGKSEGIGQLAARLREVTGKRVEITDVRLLLFSPIDLRGIPTHNADKTLSVWLRPQIFSMDEDESVINILFLDELSAAPQSVQAAAYQICLDRKVGEHRLPENCIVIAAGNRTNDQSVSYKMPKALCNRLMHFCIESDFDSWRNWAIKNGVDSRIIGYLSFDNSRLCSEPGTSDMAYTTPRSWSFVNTVLKTMGESPERLHRLIGGCVGLDAAIEFEQWCKINSDLPKIEDILSGNCAVYPKNQDTLYVLSASLVTAVYSRRKNVLVEELENVCAYAKRFPADFAMSFFKDMTSIEDIRLKLMKCDSMKEWLSVNKRFM